MYVVDQCGSAPSSAGCRYSAGVVGRRISYRHDSGTAAVYIQHLLFSKAPDVNSSTPHPNTDFGQQSHDLRQ